MNTREVKQSVPRGLVTHNPLAQSRKKFAYVDVSPMAMDYKIPFTSSSSLRAFSPPHNSHSQSNNSFRFIPSPRTCPDYCCWCQKIPPFAVSTEIKSSAVMSHDHDPSQECDDGCNSKAQFSPPPGSDQLSQQNGGGSKRKRVSLACNACRTRKSKVSCSSTFSVGLFSVEEELSTC